MYKLYSYWSAPQPEDVEAFEEYYLSTHCPKAEAVPHLERLVTSRTTDGFEGGEPMHYRIAELAFADREALAKCAESEQWKALRECSAGIIERFGVTLTVEAGDEVIADLPGELSPMAICVTGGSSGLGRAIAERFAPGGTDVFINYHANDAAADEAAAAVEAAGGIPHLVKADVSTEAGCAAVIGAVRAKVDHLDQLVHGAAKAQTGSLLEMSSADLRESIAVNGIALVDLVREALPIMGEGSTVFYLTSRGARFVIPNYGSLGTAKALGEHIVRYLARECAPRGVRVLSVSPGAVDTAAFRSMFPDTYEDRLAAAAAANPMGRGVTVEDCAALVEMLADPELTMVQGQTITADGGASL